MKDVAQWMRGQREGEGVMSGEQILAVLVASVCAMMLVRLCLPGSRRAQLDRFMGRQWALTSSRVKRLFRSRATRQSEAAQAEQARQATAAAIERARRASRVTDVAREGNIYKPEAFQKPRKPH